MSIYKVRIKSDGNKTTYTTNATVLMTITHIPDLNKFELSADGKSLLIDTAEEADNVARQKITALFTKLGIVPDFIKE